MTIEQSKKQRKIPYRKPESIKELEKAYFEYECNKYPNFPNYARVTPIFRDDNANGLTKCIVKWLEMNGYFAGRVNTTGTYSQKLKKYIHSGSKRGMADVTAVINGRHVSIEVKVGKDKLREAQINVKREIEQAGGIYIVASSFDNFLKQITKMEFLNS